jgi:hypothetical protein
MLPRCCLPLLPVRREDADVPGPSWLAGALAVVMIMIAVYCAARLVVSRLSRRKTEADADAVHVLMGVAMAGMFLPWLSPLPSAVWEVMFGTAAAWFAWQAARARSGHPAGGWQCPYPVPHLVECGTMLYMLLQVQAPQPAGLDTGTAMPGMAAPPAGAGSFPVLALILALFTLGYIAWTTDRLASLTRATTAAPDRNAAYHPALLRGTTGAPAARPQDGPGTSGAAVSVKEHPPGSPMLAPRLAACYKIAMSIAMGYMLIQML